MAKLFISYFTRVTTLIGQWKQQKIEMEKVCFGSKIKKKYFCFKGLKCVPWLVIPFICHKIYLSKHFENSCFIVK